jgi:hypothetical protein
MVELVEDCSRSAKLAQVRAISSKRALFLLSRAICANCKHSAANRAYSADSVDFSTALPTSHEEKRLTGL